MWLGKNAHFKWVVKLATKKTIMMLHGRARKNDKVRVDGKRIIYDEEDEF